MKRKRKTKNKKNKITMKKILKTLFDWRGRALQSQHLRTIVLLAFLVVGADVAWGLGIKRNISMTNVSVASNGTFTNNVYSWLRCGSPWIAHQAC